MDKPHMKPATNSQKVQWQSSMAMLPMNGKYSGRRFTNLAMAELGLDLMALLTPLLLGDFIRLPRLLIFIAKLTTKNRK